MTAPQNSFEGTIPLVQGSNEPLKIESNALERRAGLSHPSLHAYFATTRFKLMLVFFPKANYFDPYLALHYDPLVCPLKVSFQHPLQLRAPQPRGK